MELIQGGRSSVFSFLVRLSTWRELAASLLLFCNHKPATDGAGGGEDVAQNTI